MTHDQNQLNSFLASLDKNEDMLREYRGQLDRDYPDWKAKFDFDPKNIPQHDARREYFRYASVILQNVRLSFIFIRDQLLDPAWWMRINGTYSSAQALDTLYGYMAMARQYSAIQTASITERTLSSIATSEHGPFTLSTCRGLGTAYEYVLSKASLLKKYRELFDLLRLVRNTFHSNGFFSDPGGDTVKKYDGRQYDFRLGQPIRWDNDDLILMAKWISEAMWEILNSPEVRSIPHVPVAQPLGRSTLTTSPN